MSMQRRNETASWIEMNILQVIKAGKRSGGAMFVVHRHSDRNIINLINTFAANNHLSINNNFVTKKLNREDNMF